MATKKLDDRVVKSNTLIKASYTLTLHEIRLLDIALAELTTYEQCEKHVCTMSDYVEIRADYYAELYGVDMKTAYLALKDASESLFSRYFTYTVPSERFPTHLEHRKGRWVWSIGYVPNQGVVKLAFTPDLVKLAGQLNGDFSRQHIRQKSQLTSVYAHRLYEILAGWRGSKKPIDIQYHDLRFRFEIAEDEYTRLDNFKARVLKPAVKQITQLTDITVSYEDIKQGRRVTGFRFKFKFKDNKEIALKDVKKIVSDDKKIVSDDKPATDKPTTTDKPRTRNIPPMSAAQINTFANKLVNYFEFMRDCSSQTYGKSREQVIAWVSEGLADDTQRQEWFKHLLQVGYEFPDRLKK